MQSPKNPRVEKSRAYQRLVRKLTKENLWLFIISLLLNKPMYAYEVKIHLKERYGLNVATVTVYTVLYRMKHEGLLATYEESGTKYYKVTEKGVIVYKEAKRFLHRILKLLEDINNMTT